MPNQNRERLSIKANVEIKAALCFDKPILGKGPYGDYRIYAVKVNDVEYTWFASKQAHEIICERGYKKGDEIRILKDEYENDKHRYVINGEMWDDVFGGNGAPKPNENGDPSVTERLDKMGRWAKEMAERADILEERVAAMRGDLNFIEKYLFKDENQPKEPF